VNTVGPGAISPGVVWHPTIIARSERWAARRLGGVTVWFTGLSGSGKSTISNEVARLLLDGGRAVYLLDGDNLRFGLNGDLGFDRASREENVRRVGEVARLMADAGIAALVPVISPYRDGRDRVQRDPKGLYAKARAGELTGFTGIDDPYEPPLRPDLVLDTTTAGPPELAAKVIALLG
jgi:bifunctional enzyme CysN/CysC